MQLSFLFFGNIPDEKWQLARQMGIRYAIAKLAPELTGQEPPDVFESLQQSRDIFLANGLELIGLEGDQFDMTRVKLGLPGRDEDLDRYCDMLAHMGRLGITLLCYNFMASGWYRTSTTVPERGGALVSGFDAAVADQLPLTEHGVVPAETIWANYAYFLARVLPHAERAGVRLALHPDDPPVPSLRGIGRIFTSAAAMRRALALAASPAHGLTFCQGTYTTMGEDVPALVREFGLQGRIHFVHVRDVAGRAESFHETFPDDGLTDMAAVFRAYQAIGFAGPIRSDHAPTMAGEANAQPGYETKGHLFGIGYIKGLLDALGIASS